MRAPDEAGLGKAKVTFSFDGWAGGRVSPSTIALPVVRAEPEKKDAK